VRFFRALLATLLVGSLPLGAAAAPPSYYGNLYAAGRPTFDATYYGAVCNGTTDTTTAVQAAITAAQTAGGGTVLLPLGVCRVHGLLVSANNIYIQGQGAANYTNAGSLPSTALKYNGTAGGTILTFAAPGAVELAGGGVSNLDLEANSASAATGIKTQGLVQGVFTNLTSIPDGAFTTATYWLTYASGATPPGSSELNFSNIMGLNYNNNGAIFWLDGTYNSILSNLYLATITGTLLHLGGGTTLNDESDTTSIYHFSGLIPAAYTGTATSTTATSLTVAGTPWTVNQWVGSYVSVAFNNYAIVTSNTSSTLNATAGWAAGTPSGTTAFGIYAGTEVLFDCNSRNEYVNDFVPVSLGQGYSALAKGTTACVGLNGASTNNSIFNYQAFSGYTALPIAQSGGQITTYEDVGTVLSTGAFNFANGVASTTGAFSGNVASTATGSLFSNNSPAVTGNLYIGPISNTGNTSYFGVESSGGGSILGGCSAYALCIGTASARSLQLATNNAVDLTMLSGGAATFTSTLEASALSNSTTTVGYVPPTYTVAGAVTGSTVHTVLGTCAFVASVTCTPTTFTGAAVFTSATSYACDASGGAGTFAQTGALSVGSQATNSVVITAAVSNSQTVAFKCTGT